MHSTMVMGFYIFVKTKTEIFIFRDFIFAENFFHLEKNIKLNVYAIHVSYTSFLLTIIIPYIIVLSTECSQFFNKQTNKRFKNLCKKWLSLSLHRILNNFQNELLLFFLFFISFENIGQNVERKTYLDIKTYIHKQMLK